ncbi:hypothetical protein Taro_055814 [Colocasia esculenta]|uniref:Uncharacterized protein n=1 Tax=Colocasia esculenta TaxID=4460 RepID=A0A843XVF3_COLES|nr:hypothetical protein [Colocasia esculenta]
MSKADLDIWTIQMIQGSPGGSGWSPPLPGDGRDPPSLGGFLGPPAAPAEVAGAAGHLRRPAGSPRSGHAPGSGLAEMEESTMQGLPGDTVTSSKCI